MNLDQLISQYLDGELTESEDLELRNLLRENKSFKEEFDSAVELHHAIQEDAKSIEAPRDFLNKVEDNILMNIISSSDTTIKNQPLIKSKRRRRYAFNSILSFAVITFLFISSQEFSDNYIGIFPELTENENVIRNQPEAINSEDIKISTVDSVEITKSQTNDFYSNLDLNLTKVELVENNIDLAQLQMMDNYYHIERDNLIPIADNLTERSLSKNIRSEDIKKAAFSQSYELSSISLSSSGISNHPMANYNQFSMPAKSRISIELGSFMSSEFENTGFTNNLNSQIVNLSQSFSYSIDDKSKIGLEFGYAQFDYNNTVTLDIPVENFNVESSVEVPGGENLVINTPVNVRRELNSYWGSLFYDRELYEINNLSITGRIGAGSSMEGLLGYSRLLVSYRLFNFLKISAGTEARLQGLNIDGLTNSPYTGTYSLIYGIEFDL